MSKDSGFPFLIVNQRLSCAAWTCTCVVCVYVLVCVCVCVYALTKAQITVLKVGGGGGCYVCMAYTYVTMYSRTSMD